jgi:hypothetical protein
MQLESRLATIETALTIAPPNEPSLSTTLQGALN